MNKQCLFSGYLVRYFLGELDSRTADKIATHLPDCLQCQQEMQTLKAVFQAAEEIGQDLKKEAEAIDWDVFARRIEQKVRRSEPLSSFHRPPAAHRFLQPWRLAIAGGVAGLLLGLAISLYLIRPRPTPPFEKAFYQVSDSFLERVDEEVARRAILDYLEKSRLVLLSLRESTEQPGQISLILPQQERLRQLLNEKKYLASKLEAFSLTKAKAILEEIDGLLLELALIQETSSAEETSQISRLIEERRLLLKIQLLRHELEESEGRT